MTVIVFACLNAPYGARCFLTAQMEADGINVKYSKS